MYYTIYVIQVSYENSHFENTKRTEKSDVWIFYLHEEFI